MDTTPQPATVVADVEAIKKSNKKKLVWGIICLVGPTVLFVVSILLYAVVNFVFTATAPETAGTEFSGNPLMAIVNVLLFIVGALVVATWLPGIVVGIILLATRKPLPTN